MEGVLTLDRPEFGSPISHVRLAEAWVAPAGGGDGGQWGSPGWALATLGSEASRPASSRSSGLGALPGGAFQARQPLLSRPPPQGWRLPESPPGRCRAGGCGLWWPRELQATGAARGPRGRPANSDLPPPAAGLRWARWGRAPSARSSFSCCSSPAPERGLPRSVSPQPVSGYRFPRRQRRSRDVPRSTPVPELRLGAQPRAGALVWCRGAGVPRLSSQETRGDLGGSAWEWPAGEGCPGTSETLVFCGSR